MSQNDRAKRLHALFKEAFSLEDIQRRWFLHSIDDRELAADVERLLESSACCGSFTETEATREKQ